MLEDLDHAFHDESSHEARLLVASDHRGPLGTLISLDRPVPTIGLVYVKVAARRRGVARQLISRALGDYRGPWDGWSLPGDRATKSLYESLGHKARLLTMSGERVPDGATDA
jgi:GNAT superfamily N-acetyltransferase